METTVDTRSKLLGSIIPSKPAAPALVVTGGSRSLSQLCSGEGGATSWTSCQFIIAT